MSLPAKFVHPRPPYNKNPVYHRRPPASPIYLSQALVLQSGASGAVNDSALANPMNQDMEILEVRFEVSGNLVSQGSFGGSIGCEFVLGGAKITNGSIPLWNFGRVDNTLADQEVGDSQGSPVSGAQESFAYYSWQLPRPLFIPAGSVLSPKFTHNGVVKNSLNVRVGYSARSVFVQPKQICVPWVACYTSKSFNPTINAATDSSTAFDLVNANPEELHLQRFAGRALLVRNNVVYSDTPSTTFERLLTMRMSDSYGRPLIRTYTPFQSVFSITRSWEMDNGTTLDPFAFYNVQLKNAASSAVGGVGNDTASAQVMISMVGWRELGSLS